MPNFIEVDEVLLPDWLFISDDFGDDILSPVALFNPVAAARSKEDAFLNSTIIAQEPKKKTIIIDRSSFAGINNCDAIAIMARLDMLRFEIYIRNETPKLFTKFNPLMTGKELEEVLNKTQFLAVQDYAILKIAQDETIVVTMPQTLEIVRDLQKDRVVCEYGVGDNFSLNFSAGNGPLEKVLYSASCDKAEIMIENFKKIKDLPVLPGRIDRSELFSYGSIKSAFNEKRFVPPIKKTLLILKKVLGTEAELAITDLLDVNADYDELSAEDKDCLKSFLVKMVTKTNRLLCSELIKLLVILNKLGWRDEMVLSSISWDKYSQPQFINPGSCISYRKMLDAALSLPEDFIIGSSKTELVKKFYFIGYYYKECARKLHEYNPRYYEEVEQELLQKYGLISGEVSDDLNNLIEDLFCYGERDCDQIFRIILKLTNYQANQRFIGALVKIFSNDIEVFERIVAANVDLIKSNNHLLMDCINIINSSSKVQELLYLLLANNPGIDSKLKSYIEIAIIANKESTREEIANVKMLMLNDSKFNWIDIVGNNRELSEYAIEIYEGDHPVEFLLKIKDEDLAERFVEREISRPSSYLSKDLGNYNGKFIEIILHFPRSKNIAQKLAPFTRSGVANYSYISNQDFSVEVLDILRSKVSFNLDRAMNPNQYHPQDLSNIYTKLVISNLQSSDDVEILKSAILLDSSYVYIMEIDGKCDEKSVCELLSSDIFLNLKGLIIPRENPFHNYKDLFPDFTIVNKNNVEFILHDAKQEGEMRLEERKALEEAVEVSPEVVSLEEEQLISNIKLPQNTQPFKPSHELPLLVDVEDDENYVDSKIQVRKKFKDSTRIIPDSLPYKIPPLTTTLRDRLIPEAITISSEIELSRELAINPEYEESRRVKTLLIAQDVDGHANFVIRQARDYGRQIFYIDDLDKLEFEQDKIMVVNDGVRLKTIQELSYFLGIDEKEKPILLIKWPRDPAKRLELNTIIDDKKRTIKGVDIPPGFQIIGLADQEIKDVSFVTRQDQILQSGLQLDIQRLPDMSDAIEIDLKGFPNWREHLFGEIILKEEGMVWNKSYFAECLESGVKKFKIKNISAKDAKELQKEFARARAYGYLECHGIFGIPEDFIIECNSDDFDFREFDARNILVQKDVKYSSALTGFHLVNTHLFDKLLAGYYINEEEKKYIQVDGLVKQHAGGELRLFITSDFSKAQWYCLLRLAQEYGVRLNLALAPGVRIPALYTSISTLVVESEAADSANKIILTRDGKATVARIREALSPLSSLRSGDPGGFVTKDMSSVITIPGSALREDDKGEEGEEEKEVEIINIEDFTYQDLISKIDFKKANGAFTDFTVIKSKILQKLLAGKKIILCGKFPSGLLRALEPLIIGQEPEFGKIVKDNLTLVVESESLSNPALSWINYEKDEETEIPRKKPANVIYDERHGIPRQQGREEDKAIAFIEGRMTAFASALHENSMLELVGHSGVGKSRLLRRFKNKTGCELYNGFDAFHAWANDRSNKLKILFIDEANMVKSNFTIFEQLKPDGTKRLFYKSKDGGEIYELDENHKVVFARNPKEYGGGRIEQKLFSDGEIPQIYLEDFSVEYIYQRILKKAIYDKMSEALKAKVPQESFREKCQELIDDYYKNNAAEPLSLTVRELQEEAFKFLFLATQEEIEEEKIPSTKFTSTEATKKAEEDLQYFIKSRIAQSQGFGALTKAIGLNGILLEGDSGSGKSEMIRYYLENSGKIYYKIDANQSQEEKERIITQAFEEGNFVWIDEFDSFIKDGSERFINAVTTGFHPVTGERSSNPGFGLIASANQLGEGRSIISPALRHRMICPPLTALKDYEIEDFVKIISSWSEEFLSPENLDAVRAIARDFKKLLQNPKNHGLNLRGLRKDIENIFAEYKKFEHSLYSSPEAASSRAFVIEKGNSNKISLAFRPQAIMSQEKKRRYENKDETYKGSYRWFCKKIKELGYENIFIMDDETKSLYFRAPISTLPDLELFSDLARVFSINRQAFSYQRSTYHHLYNFTSGILPEGLEFDDKENFEGATYRQFCETFKEFFRKKKVSPSQAKIEKIADIFNYPGFCLGESSHGEAASKRFFIENMAQFKAMGYDTLFLENLQYDSTIQEALDHYFALPPESSMPRDLENYLIAIDRNNNNQSDLYNLKQLVVAAKQQGVRIVAIDTVASMMAGEGIYYGMSGQEREAGMNYAAYKIMQRELHSHPGKWMALMGTAHLRQIHEEAPGVADLMGVPALITGEISAKGGERVKIHVGHDIKSDEARCDVKIMATLNSSLKFDAIGIDQAIPTPTIAVPRVDEKCCVIS